MFELKPIILDNGIITIHPIRNSDLIPEKYEKIKNDLFAIYNNEITTKYIPEKKVKTLNDIEMKLAKARLGYGMKTFYSYFITLNKFDKVIGEINIISPLGSSDYSIKNMWFIEYAKYQNIGKYGIMTNAISAVLSELYSQGLEKIGAVSFPENISSINILKKLGFKKIKGFDNYQDYYELNLKNFQNNE